MSAVNLHYLHSLPSVGSPFNAYSLYMKCQHDLSHSIFIKMMAGMLICRHRCYEQIKLPGIDAIKEY